jgi:hypothetical protein
VFETSSLIDAAYLNAKGFHTVESKPRGSLIVFVVDIAEREAEQLLASPERDTCEAFARAWRDLRKEMDRVLGGRRR